MSFVPSFEHYGTYDESEYPHLWNGRVLSLCPSVNPAGGSKLFDHSFKQCWGTLTNGPAWQTKTGRTALAFDGSNDYVSFGAEGIGKLVNGATAITVSAWVNLNTIPTGSSDSMIFLTRNSAAAGTASSLWCNVRGDVGFVGKVQYGGRSSSADTFQGLTTGAAISTGVWNHLCFVMNFATARVHAYLNGGLDSSYTATFASSTYAHSASAIVDAIGSDPNITTRTTNGFIDDVFVSLRELPASEIRELYQLGPGGAYTPRTRMSYPLPPQQTFLAAWAFQANKIIQYGVAS